jgi:hypothetical protein
LKTGINELYDESNQKNLKVEQNLNKFHKISYLLTDFVDFHDLHLFT